MGVHPTPELAGCVSTASTAADMTRRRPLNKYALHTRAVTRMELSLHWTLLVGGTMAKQLKGKRVAALVTTGFEQVELNDPRRALTSAGATVHIVAPDARKVRGWNHTEWGDEVDVDQTLDQARADDYDALLLPGGVMNPDHLRMNAKAVDFVKRFFDEGKPIAVICHGPWTLVEAGVVHGITMTSYPSVRTDLQNAGATWVDREVVVDRGIVSARRPSDIPAFNTKMIEEFEKGRHGSAGARQLTHTHA